jgi:hypothetical protein
VEAEEKMMSAWPGRQGKPINDLVRFVPPADECSREEGRRELLGSLGASEPTIIVQQSRRQTETETAPNTDTFWINFSEQIWRER